MQIQGCVFARDIERMRSRTTEKARDHSSSAVSASQPPEAQQAMHAHAEDDVISPKAINEDTHIPGADQEVIVDVEDQLRPTKRASSITIEQRNSKKPRVEIDLTADDDDDIVVIKEEKISRINTKRKVDMPGTEEEGDLQAKLAEISRQRRELQLDRGEAEFKRKLQSMRKHVTPAVKSEGFIKIED